jgi:hypothetical protein
MSAPVRHLRVLDVDTGEALDRDVYIVQLEDQIAGLQRDVKAEHLRYENLKRDKAREAQEHGLFPKVKELFDYWRKTTGHLKSKFMPERFWQAVAFLEDYGEDACRLAIDGAAFDPFETIRKNGSRKKHDGWHLIFRDADKFEDFANRAPREGDENGSAGATPGGTPQSQQAAPGTRGAEGGGPLRLPGFQGAV